MWSHIIPAEIGAPRSHGTCGVHIGSFTRHFENVDCLDCQEVIYRKLMADDLITVEERPSDWKAHITGDTTKWDSGSTPLKAAMKLVKSWPYLLEDIV